jgi:hypothetical protein
MIAVMAFGISFVLQRNAMLNGIPPLTYNACRYFVSTILLLIYKFFTLALGNSRSVDTSPSKSTSTKYSSVQIEDDRDESESLSIIASWNVVSKLWFW